MSVVPIFFEELWPTLVITAVVLSLLWSGMVISLGRNASSLGPNQFDELTSFSRPEQVRILHDADRKAFGGWRLIIPPLMYSVVVSVSIAGGQTLSKVVPIRDQLGTSVAITLLLAALGVWIVRRIEHRRIRPFVASEKLNFRRQP
jgi:hypothetical protein